MNFKTGDKVIVITGKDRGKQGTITKILKDKNKVIVEGVNVFKKSVKPNGNNTGGIVEKLMPIHASNVMIYDEKSKKGTRIGHTTDKNNKKVRITKSSNTKLD